MEVWVLAFKFMSDLFQKSTLCTIMLFSFGNPTHIALFLSLLFFTLVIYTQCLNFLYGISYRLLRNEWPKAERIKTTNIYYFSASLGQEQLSWEIPPQGLLHQLGRQLSTELTGCGGSTFRLAHSCDFARRTHFPTSYWQEASGSCHMDLSIVPLKWPHVMAAGFPLSEWSNREQDRNQSAFSELALEVTLIIPAPSC